MGKNRSREVQRTTVQPDAASQGYINDLRNQSGQFAQTALNTPTATGPLTQTPEEMAQAFMNPYISNVVDATRGEFDHLRGQAGVQANQMATQGGAFGGSRHGIAEGTRLGALDRSQASTISQLLNSGYQNALTQGVGFAEHQRQLTEQQMQDPIIRAQAAQGFLNNGMGPTGQTQTTSVNERRNPLGSAAGGALTGFGVGGPIGGVVGGGLGLLGGLFG